MSTRFASGKHAKKNLEKIQEHPQPKLMTQILRKLQNVNSLMGDDHAQDFFDAIIAHENPMSAVITGVAYLKTIARLFTTTTTMPSPKAVSLYNEITPNLSQETIAEFILTRIKTAPLSASTAADICDRLEKLKMHFNKDDDNRDKLNIIFTYIAKTMIPVSRTSHPNKSRIMPISRNKHCLFFANDVYHDQSREISMPGDGNCFFHTAVYGLKEQKINTDTDHLQARMRSVAYLMNHQELLSDFLTDDESGVEYLANMACEGEYVEGPIIEAFALEFKVHLFIKNMGANDHEDHININQTPGVRGTIGFIRRGNIHYNALSLITHHVLQDKDSIISTTNDSDDQLNLVQPFIPL